MRNLVEFAEELAAVVDPITDDEGRRSHRISFDCGEPMSVIQMAVGSAAINHFPIPDRLLDEAWYWGIELNGVRPRAQAKFRQWIAELRTLASP